jgi:hypothetical protein
LNARVLVLRNVIVGALLVIGTAWACAAVWIDGPEPRVLAGALAALLAGVPVVAFAVLRPIRRAFGCWLLSFALVVAWWTSLAPSNERVWLPDVANLPVAEFDGDFVTIRNVRNFDYRGEDDYTARWEERRFDLSRIRGVDLFLSYWSGPYIAHTIASWDFASGGPLAISIETRKEAGEEYSAVLGFFRQYELYYVVADERDLVGLRTNHRGEDVYLYRVRMSPERARALLVDYLEEINALVDAPRWYNALTHNCTTMIRHHVQHVLPDNPWDWRVLVNGLLDQASYERGTINTTLPFAELRERSNIVARAQAAGTSADFSARIREGLPERPVDQRP